MRPCVVGSLSNNARMLLNVVYVHMIVLEINPTAQFSPKKKLWAPEWRKFPQFLGQSGDFYPLFSPVSPNWQDLATKSDV